MTHTGIQPGLRDAMMALGIKQDPHADESMVKPPRINM